MPSLNALREFKTSFQDIANEKEDVLSKDLQFDDLTLPKNEAPPFDYSRSTVNASAAPAGSAPASPADSGAGTGDFDFSAFLNDIPGDTPATPDALDDLLGLGTAAPGDAPDDESALDDFLQDSAPQTGAAQPDAGGTDDTSFLDDLMSDTPKEEPQPDLPQNEPQPDMSMSDEISLPDEGSFPEDLLSGFSDEMESSPADFKTGDSQTDDFAADDFSTGDSVAVDSPSGGLPADDFDISSFLSDDAGNLPSGESLDDTPFDLNLPDDEFSSDDSGAINMGSESRDGDGFELPDFDIDAGSSVPDSDFASEDFAPAENKDDIDLGGDLPDFDTPADSGDFSMDFPADDAGADSFDSSLPDIDFPTDDSTGSDDFNVPLPDADFSSDANDLDGLLGDMDFSSDGGASEDSGFSSGGDDFLPPIEDFGADFASDTIDTGTTDTGSAAAQSVEDAHVSDVFSEEFHIPGLDDMFDKSKTEQPVSKPDKKGFPFGRKKTNEEETPDISDVEEISLSQSDVNSLMKTLSVFPLNLRIACEEIIAEQVILPQQLSKLINLLISGPYIKETAALVEQITGKPVVIPKSFQKGTGAAFEAEQASFAYIFVHNFLPVLRLFAVIIALTGSVIYLSYKFIYVPLRAESIYKRGYERIPAGEYQRANDLFQQAFDLHRNKKWFYAYAEAFRDQRRYMYAEGKYDELLRYYPRDKKGVLDYANLQTNYLLNYDKANRLLQRELLDYAPNDKEGLLAAGDNFLAWADSNPTRFFDKYEDARFSYARWLELYGWQPGVVERMLKYFIRIDDLKEVLQLRGWFEADPKRDLSASSLAELGGYLLDKQLEKPKGVPNPYVENIESVRDMLLKAVKKEPNLPEPHYHLARYHKNLGNSSEERKTLENAIRAFDIAKQESIRRRLYRVDAHYRYANNLIEAKEFFPAEEQVVKGIEHYEDYLNRNLVPGAPALGKLYSLWGDLEYFVKSGNMEAALSHYHKGESYGYAPPEVQYRMGSAYYLQENWRNAIDYLFKASADLPLNRRMLFALGNAAYQRGDYYASQGYYNRLLDLLELQRIRLPVLLPNDSVQFLETGERLMMARNNLGVVNEALAAQTGNRTYRSRAMTMYAESARAWDAITRNPESMTRMSLTDRPGAPGINLGYLNANNALRPNSGYRPEIFIRIDRDVLEPSKWEELAPFGGF